MKIEVIEKPDWVSWEQITVLLHAAFAEHAARGLTYAACNQTVEHTINRANGATCLVALVDGELGGTACISVCNKILRGKVKCHFTQHGIHPRFKGRGVGRAILLKASEIAKAAHAEAIYADTAAKADGVIAFHLKCGFQIVGLKSHATTNYYSVCFRKPICGRCYGEVERKFRYYLSYMICKLCFKENGDFTFIGGLARKIKRTIKKYILRNA